MDVLSPAIGGHAIVLDSVHDDLRHPERHSCGGVGLPVRVRDLVRQGRIARLRVAAQDQPGALAKITAKFFEGGVNIIEIRHSRIFTALPAKDTVIEVECEARDSAAIDQVEAMLKAAGFHVDRASLD